MLTWMLAACSAARPSPASPASRSGPSPPEATAATAAACAAASGASAARCCSRSPRRSSSESMVAFQPLSCLSSFSLLARRGWGVPIAPSYGLACLRVGQNDGAHPADAAVPRQTSDRSIGPCARPFTRSNPGQTHRLTMSYSVRCFLSYSACSFAPCSLNAVCTSSCSSMAASASWWRWRSISACVR